MRTHFCVDKSATTFRLRSRRVSKATANGLCYNPVNRYGVLRGIVIDSPVCFRTFVVLSTAVTTLPRQPPVKIQDDGARCPERIRQKCWDRSQFRFLRSHCFSFLLQTAQHRHVKLPGALFDRPVFRLFSYPLFSFPATFACSSFAASLTESCSMFGSRWVQVRGMRPRI